MILLPPRSPYTPEQHTVRQEDSFHSHESMLNRRHILSRGAAALTSLSRPQRLSAMAFEDSSFLDTLLRSSSIYDIQVDASTRASPSANRLSANRLVRKLGSQRAIFLGEHHPALRDHLLQAALLRSLCTTRSRQQPLAVGLEAVQRQFQPVLNDYIAGRIGEAELFDATDWERRWYWPFEYYAPIFRICREYDGEYFRIRTCALCLALVLEVMGLEWRARVAIGAERALAF